MTAARASDRRVRPLPRAATAAIWALAIGVPAAYALLVLVSPPPDQDAWAFPLYGSIVATWVIAGAFVTTRQPGNRVGWVLLTGGLMMGLALLGQLWAYYSLAVRGGTLPGTVAGPCSASCSPRRSTSWP